MLYIIYIVKCTTMYRIVTFISMTGMHVCLIVDSLELLPIPGDHVIPLYIPQCKECMFCLDQQKDQPLQQDEVCLVV